MFCKNCGKELAESAKFCTKCGTRVAEPLTEKVAVETGAKTPVKAAAETDAKATVKAAVETGAKTPVKATVATGAKTADEPAAKTAPKSSYVSEKPSLLKDLFYWEGRRGKSKYTLILIITTVLTLIGLYITSLLYEESLLFERNASMGNASIITGIALMGSSIASFSINIAIDFVAYVNMVKRLHDINKSYLLAFIYYFVAIIYRCYVGIDDAFILKIARLDIETLVGFIMFNVVWFIPEIWLCVVDGDANDNKYGPVPVDKF